MASEAGRGATLRRRTTKHYRSHHAMQHLPQGQDEADVVQAFRDDDDSEGPDDEELKAIPVTMSAKRKIKYVCLFRSRSKCLKKKNSKKNYQS